MLAESGTFIQRFTELYTDPAHWSFELLGPMLVVDVLIVGVGWRFIRRYINRRHQSDIENIVEAEHGFHAIDDGHDHAAELEDRVVALEAILREAGLMGSECEYCGKPLHGLDTICDECLANLED